MWEDRLFSSRLEVPHIVRYREYRFLLYNRLGIDFSSLVVVRHVPFYMQSSCTIGRHCSKQCLYLSLGKSPGRRVYQVP